MEIVLGIKKTGIPYKTNGGLRRTEHRYKGDTVADITKWNSQHERHEHHKKKTGVKRV